MSWYKKIGANAWESLTSLLEENRARERRSFRTPLPASRTRRLGIESLDQRNMLSADVLYIGDGGSNSVEQFDAQSGAFVRNAAPTGAAIHGPRGLLVAGDQLLVVNQNANTDFNGEVIAFDRYNATSQTSPVSSNHPQAPFAPRGMVLKDNILYIADFEGTNYSRIVKYNFTTGNYAGELVPAGFNEPFQPRGLVFGPDGGLYVSGFSSDTFGSADPAGYIFRFDITNGSYRVVSANNGDGLTQAGEQSSLHNPEGIVFGPDGRIYVTSNTSNANTEILVIDPTNGQVVESHQLSTDDSNERVTAEAIVFGPDGNLFVPVLVSSAYFQRAVGGVWKYDSISKQFDRSFIPHDYFSPVLTEPWYISFGQTDPATLAYVSTQQTNQPPVLSNLETNMLTQTTGSREFVCRSIRITDQDSLKLTGAEIKVAANYQLQSDSLYFRDRGNIHGSWNIQTGTLTLTGSDTVANYQSALQSVLFQSSRQSAGPRTISFSVRDDAAQWSSSISRQVVVIAAEKVCNPATPLSSAQLPTSSPQRINAVLGNPIVEVK